MRDFRHVEIEELKFNIKSEYTSKGRVYLTPDGKRYPSVTTVLSGMNKEAILEWRKRVGEQEAGEVTRKAARRGNILHNLCERYLLNDLTDDEIHGMMPSSKQMFIPIRNILNENIGDIYALEQSLYSHRLKIAGRVDCIAQWGGKRSVIDFKTSSKFKKEDWIKNYFMQCTAYSCMYHEITGNPINQIVVIVSVEDSKEPQIFVKSKLDYLEDTITYIKNYHEGLL